MKKIKNELITQITEDGKEVDYSHSQNALGDDRTLCGMALEGMGRKTDCGDDWHSFSIKTDQPVNCPKCLQIIKFCRGKLLNF